MSFVVAACALLLALLTAIVLDDAGARKWQQPRREVPSFDMW
jgi:hypothetical protein